MNALFGLLCNKSVSVSPCEPLLGNPGEDNWKEMKEVGQMHETACFLLTHLKVQVYSVYKHIPVDFCSLSSTSIG